MKGVGIFLGITAVIVLAILLFFPGPIVRAFVLWKLLVG